jgi:membrane protein DedA with SNARE-associated domain
MESHGGWVDALSQFGTLAFHFCASVSQFDIRHMVVQHGHWFYLITFLWTFVEGETFVIFAATFAAQGLLDPFLLLISAWLGSFSGDQL